MAYETEPPNDPLVELSFDGPAIKDGRILLGDLLQFVSGFQSAVERTVNVLESGVGTRVGRPPDAFRVLSALEVVAQSKGSFSLSLDLRREAPMLPEFDVGSEAIGLLADGLNLIDGVDKPLPDGYDSGVLMALRDAGRVLDRGIASVSIRTITATGTRMATRATYNQRVRTAISMRLDKYRQAWVSVEGRLLMADVKEDTLRCRLHPSTGDPILCSYDESMAGTVIRNLRSFVRARGEASVDPTTKRIRRLKIGDIEAIDEPPQPGVTVLSSYWHPTSFEELAEEQGVYPVESWESLTGGWPEDADFDQFIEDIQSVRSG